MEDRTLLSTFVVSNTDDSGPGSLRQAILDSNATTYGTNRIQFDIPGSGAQTIVPIAPLPPITTSVLVDGTTQPGFAGASLVALSGQLTGSQPALAVSAPNVSISGLAVDRVTIDSADERLIAVVHTQGSRLSLLDSEEKPLVQATASRPAIPTSRSTSISRPASMFSRSRLRVRVAASRSRPA